MKIVPMSDKHGYLPKPDTVPECDVIVDAGDIVPLEYQNDDCASIAWFCLEFVPWVDSLPCKKYIFVGGNHDFFLEHIMYGPVREDGSRKIRTASETLKKLLPGNNKSKHSKLVYLRDNSVDIEGKRFYGTPWISGLPKWAFNKTEEELAETYSNIPKKCDVLITHMPPAIGEAGTVLEAGWNYGRNFSSEALAEAMRSRDILYTFCGHVHSGHHMAALYESVGERQHWVVNASVKDERYQVQTYYFPTYDI